MIIKKLIKLYKKNSFYLNFLPHEFQKKEIRKNTQLISKIYFPSIELQEIAVSENGYHLQYIKKPNNHIIKLALKENLNSFELVSNPSEKVQLFFILQAYKTYNFFIIDFFIDKISSPLVLKKLESLLKNTFCLDYMVTIKIKELDHKIKNSKYYKDDANIVLDFIKKGG